MQEFRVSRFEVLPTIVKNIIIINVLVYLAQQVFVDSKIINIEDTFALHTAQSSLFRPWQLLTHMFMHATVEHIFFNMFALWMFGSILENLWGPRRFLIFYLICGLGAALAHMSALYFSTQEIIDEVIKLKSNFNEGTFQNFFVKFNLDNYYPGSLQFMQTWQLHQNDPGLASQAMELVNKFADDHMNEATLGASGAVFGCLAAFGYLFPNTYLYILALIPVKAKWLVLGYAAVELFLALKNSAGDDVAHIAHLGGALFGFALVYFWNKKNRNTFY